VSLALAGQPRHRRRRRRCTNSWRGRPLAKSRSSSLRIQISNSISSSEAALSAEHLLTFKVADLRKFCRARSLKVSGKKDELVQRIVAYDASESQDEGEADASDETSDANPLALGSGGGNLPKQTSKDKFVQALEKDELNDVSLEEIFNIHMPEPGEAVSGVVTSIMEWGAFVELDETGWSGLIHVSEISDEFIDNIEDYLHPGQKVEAMVIRSPGDRLDRLSLSMRRLHSPPALHKAMADGKITSQELGSLRNTSTTSPVAKRVTHLEDLLQKMEVRLSAAEAVLIQLGHAHALQAAQVEAHDATQRLSVPPMEMMLSGIPPCGEEKARSQKESEKDEIDSILKDLMVGDAEVDSVDGGAGPRRLNAIDLGAMDAEPLRRFPGGDLDRELEELDSEEVTDTRSPPRDEELRASNQAEVPDARAMFEPVADMLSDSFLTSTGLPNMPM